MSRLAIENIFRQYPHQSPAERHTRRPTIVLHHVARTISGPRASARSRRQHPAGHRNAKARQAPSFFVKRCDHAFGAKLLEQIEYFAFANFWIDAIFGKQRCTESPIRQGYASRFQIREPTRFNP